MRLLASLLCLAPLLGKLFKGGGDPSRLLRFPPSLSPCRPGHRERGTLGRPSLGIRSGVAGAAGIWELREGSEVLGQPPPSPQEPCDSGSLPGASVPGRSLAALPGTGGRRWAAASLPRLKLELHIGHQHVQELPTLFAAGSCAPFDSNFY